MQVVYKNYIENQQLYHAFDEPLFLKPDGNRTRYCIGWNGYGRYIPGTLKVMYNGLPCNITEEDNGIWYNFDIAPGSNTNYDDYTVTYTARPLDYAFSIGDPVGGYPNEEYFLFPNWNNALGEGEAFWVGKYQSSNNNENIPQSRSNANIWTTINRDNAIIRAKSKGIGFGVMRNRQWVSIALWTSHHNIHVKGNIYGNNINNLDGDGTTLTQVGGGYIAYNNYYGVTGNNIPNSWNHNGLESGIHHMVGNFTEIIDGLENRAGEIYIFAEDNETYVDSGINISSNPTDIVVVDISNTSSSILNEGIANTVSTNGYIPSNLDGDVAWYNSTSNKVFGLFRGGDMFYGSRCGLWMFMINSYTTYNDWNNCFRLSRKLLD